MVVKFFRNRTGGSSKAIDYLLNERESTGEAKVLLGDPNLTKTIINAIERKQKVTVGCLSFEEKNIPENKKYEIMQDFEKHLLAGLTKEQYNILWVEHTDKERLELNFVIPKQELTSGKALNPYYHKADLPRIEKWQDLNNLNYGFSNPKNPSKSRTLETTNMKLLQKDYDQLDKILHNQVSEGYIQNREQMIELLQNNNIQVTRQTQEGLSVKLPESKRARKLKGGIYSEQFRSIETIKDISEATERRINEFDSRDTQKEIKRLREELRGYTQDKTNKLERQYPREHQKEQSINDFNKQHIEFDTRDNINALPDRILQMESTKDNEVQLSKGELYNRVDRESIIQRKENTSLYQDKQPGGIENDSIGTTAINRVRRSRQERGESLQTVRKQREDLHEAIEKSYHNLRTKSQEHLQRTRDTQQSNISTFERFTRRAKEFIQEMKVKILEKAKKLKRERSYYRDMDYGRSR